MCQSCDARAFYGALSAMPKTELALDSAGVRTVFGYYDPRDANILADMYPVAGERVITSIAGLLNAPRLLEVCAVVELIERYCERSFSAIAGLEIVATINPLSILYWSPLHQAVHRIKTHETELMHGAVEKLALRRKNLDAINEYLGRVFGLAVTTFCSCGSGIMASKDVSAFYNSSYYNTRESLGRFFDSDVLSVTNGVFGGVSLTDVPSFVFENTADFHAAEIRSAMRFARAAQSCIEGNPVRMAPHSHHGALAEHFLTGSSQRIAA